MTMITSQSQLTVGTELVLDEVARTIELVAAGNLVAKDGVTIQALYSKLVSLWTSAAYQDSPFPMYALDAKSGQWQFGTDGRKYNGWKPKDDTTRNMLRNGGWQEWSATAALPAFTDTGVMNREYVGAVALGAVNSGAQQYFQKEAGGAAINFTFTDAANQGIQVFGDATNGNFDTRTYLKGYVREYGYTFDDSTLSDTGETGTGAFKVNLLLANQQDFKITNLLGTNAATADAAMAGAPYSGITVTYYATNQNQTIGAGSYPYRVIIEGNGATAEQIYAKVQYLLRQNADIDSGTGTVTGKTADLLLRFEGETLVTSQGVFIANLDGNDSNRVIFTDQNGIGRIYPYTASGYITANTALIGAGSYYRMFFTTLPGVLDDFGESGAVTVEDALGNPIAGTITAASTSFTFAYDSNVQGGRTAGTDANVTVVAGRPGFAKPVLFGGTITRAKGITVAMIAETDRAYQ
jgi:hypothetical protein